MHLQAHHDIMFMTAFFILINFWTFLKIGMDKIVIGAM